MCDGAIVVSISFQFFTFFQAKIERILVSKNDTTKGRHAWGTVELDVWSGRWNLDNEGLEFPCDELLPRQDY